MGGGIVNRGDSVIDTSGTTRGAIIDFDRSLANRSDSFEKINVVAPWRKRPSCSCGQVGGWIVWRKYVLRFAGWVRQEVAHFVQVIFLDERRNLTGAAGCLMLGAAGRSVAVVGD